MARGWRLYPDYERSDFGRSVRAALSSASRGAAWLAAQSGLNKGTISQVLNGRRACRPEHRRRIAEAILPHLEDHEQIDRLLRSAGLPPESPVWEAPFSSVLGSSDRRPSGDPADAATRAIDESLRSHRESGQVL